jgi:hypothetical protein
MKPHVASVKQIDCTALVKANRAQQTCLSAVFEQFFAVWLAQISAHAITRGQDPAPIEERLSGLRLPMLSAYMAGVSIVMNATRPALCGDGDALADALSMFAEYDTTKAGLHAQMAINTMTQGQAH